MADSKCSVNIPTITNAFISKDGIEILSAIKAPQYIDYINILFGRVFSEEYLNNSSFITLSDFIDDSNNIKNGRNGNLINLYNKAKEQLIKDINSPFFDSLPSDVVSDISKILDNWNLFIQYHSGHNSFLSINEDEFDEENEKEYFEKKGNEFTEYQLISNEILTLFKFLPKAEHITDYKGNIIISEQYNPTTGLPVRSDFENIVKLTLDALKSVKDENEFIQILTSDDLLKKIPELEFLFKILPLKNGGISTFSNKQRFLFNKLFISFSRDYIPVFASTREETENNEDLPNHYRYRSAKGNYDKIFRKFISNFASIKGETEYVKIDTSEDEKHPERAGFGRRRLYSLPEKLQKIELTDEQIDKIKIADIQSKYKDYFDFLRILGIEFSDLSLLKSNNDKLKLINILNSTLTIHDNLSLRLDRGIKLYNPLSDILIFYQRIGNKKAAINRLTKTVKEIIKFEGMFSKISPTIMSRGASGEKRSDISLSNSLSIVSNQLSSSNSLKELYTKTYFSKLRYNPLHTDSYIATKIIGTDNTYSIENYSGHSIENNEDRVNYDTGDLTDVNKFISDYSNLLGWGVINTPQLESKSGYFALKFLDKNEKAILPFSTSANFTTSFTENTGFLDQLLSYLRGEIQRIKNYSTIKNSEYDVPEAYGQLHIFKNIVTDKQLKVLLNEDWDIDSKIIQQIKPKIESYFQNEFKKLSNFIEKNKIKSLVTQEVLRYNDISEDDYKESKEFYDNILLRSFIANSFIHNVEFGIYVSGDPLFFNDWHKRLGGLASTGVPLMNTQNLKDLFRSDSEQVHWENFSLRGILNQYTDKPISRRDNFKTYQSAVLAEDTVTSNTAYHTKQMITDYIHSVKLKTGKRISQKEAKRQLKIDGLKIDVGDGEGYINLDAHREASIRQDTYRPQHDVSYRYEALIFKKHILGKTLTEAEEAILSTEEFRINQDPDKYALPILKQTYFGGIANEEVKLDAKVFDKFSLAPLLPSMAKNHPKLKELLLAMAERQIFYVKYKSGSKAYRRNIFKSIEELANTNNRLDELYSDMLKLQILPSKKEKTKTKIPTQKIKLIFTNLFDEGNASDNVKRVRDNFLSELNNIKSNNRSYILKKLGFKTDDNGKIISWDKNEVVKRISKQITMQKLPLNFLEALEIDNNGEFLNTIESSGIYQQFINYITGKLDSTLREFKVNGGDFVLISESMFSKPLKYFRLNKDKSKIDALECRITLTKEFAKMLNLPDPKYGDRTIKSIDRLNQLLQDRNFVKKYEKELTITFSRPPVQGPNSMGVGIITEFFSPTAGNILQLPKEFMHQAGIDFDYDKEKVLLPSLSSEGIYLNDESIKNRLTELDEEYSQLSDLFHSINEHLEESEDYEDYVDMRNNLLGNDNFTKIVLDIFNYDLNNIPADIDNIVEKAREYLDLKYESKGIVDNRVLQSVIDSLQLPELFSELVIPNTFENVQRIANKNAEEIGVSNQLPSGINVYSYRENLNVFKLFNDAKSLLGSFALQNTFSQVVAPLNISINLDYAYDKDGNPTKRVNNLLLNNDSRVINISSREDIEGNNKQHLTSEFINATVDSAKDPYFANFMLSFDNIGTFLFMYNMNYPIQTIVDFTSSAIVRKFLDLKSKNPDLATEKLFILTLKEVGIPHKSTITLQKILNKDVESIDEDNSDLIKNLKFYKNDNSLNEESLKDETILNNHIKLLVNFVALKEHSKQLSSFKALFKNDTNKIISLFEIYSKQSTKNYIISNGMFSQSDVEKMEKNSTLSAYNNDDLIEDVLRNVFPILSKKNVVDTLGNLFLEQKTSLNENQSRVLSQIITNDFIGSILFTYGLYKDTNIFDYAKNLIRKEKDKDGVYNLTLLDRIYLFKQNDEYDDLVEKFSVLEKILSDVSTKPIKGNPIYNNKYAYNVLFNVDSNTPTSEKEGYMNQFKQIIEGDFDTQDPLVKDALVNLIKDFFIAGLLQSGFNKTGLSFIEYIPIKFIQSLLKPALNSYNYDSANQPENHNLFLKLFAKEFKLNNSNYFKLEPSEKKYVVKNSHLGKSLKLFNIEFVDEKELNSPVENFEENTTESPKYEFTHLSKSIDTEFQLGVDQENALKELIDFVKSDNEDIITLQGPAGTGKTSIIGYLQKYLGNRYSFAYLAPTHAATAELAFATVRTGNTTFPSTLQSGVTYNSVQNKYVFTLKIQKLLGLNPIIVIDEASMIDMDDINHLREAADDIGGKVILIGDEKQISKVVSEEEDIKSKAISPAFTNFRKINLNKIFRQSDNSLLSLLGKMREQTDFKLFKVENSDVVKFVDRKEYNRELVKDLIENPENTVVISYTNSSVKGINATARKILGRTGETQVDDIIIGYLGYASKQIEKGDIANSVSYTITDIVDNGSYKTIVAKSDKLARLIKLGIRGIESTATTNYYQLSPDDSLQFDNLTEKDYENNNESVSSVFRVIHKANEDFQKKVINYATYLSILAGVSNTLRKYSVGNDYVYNPNTDRMESFDKRKHKNIRTIGNGSLLFSKDIDYGHAITIHKSQGTTIDNVYFDSNSLKSARNTPIIDNSGNQITTERQSLAYVGMSRSKNKLVVYTGDNNFESLSDSEDVVPTDIYSQLGNKTVSKNVEIVKWEDLKEYSDPIEKDTDGNIEYIVSTRISGKYNHFGNPFSHDIREKTKGLIETKTIREAVEKYIEWITTPNLDGELSKELSRKEWIIKQLKSGQLKNKPILYYKELEEPSHATALDYLINKYNWNTITNREYTPNNIDSLKSNEIFVFGSNTQGRHGLGAALKAKEKFGAIQGQSEGLQGQSYAIITKDLTKPKEEQSKSISLNDIGKGIQNMLLFAKNNSDKKFFVTKLGSSLAGYEIKDIKNIFEKLKKYIPNNVILPKEYEVRDEISEKSSIEIKPEVLQPGFGVYKNALTQQEHDLILKYALDQFKNQGYHVKKGVAYAHWGKMWAVNDKGNAGFPVFGKYLKKDKNGNIDLPIAQITTAESIDNPNAKGWYNYYETDQNGNPLAEIPQEIKDIIKKATGYDVTRHDAAIINAYADDTVLTRHIDNTEDTTARNIAIVSISLVNSGKFFYGEGSTNSTNTNPDNKEVILNPKDIAIFGGVSRFMPHRVDVGSGNTIHVDLSDGTSGIEARRINITIRRVMPIDKDSINKEKPVGSINIYSTDNNGFNKLSNLLNGPIDVDGFKFKTVEHLYQWKKAEFFEDEIAADKIFSAKNGYDAQKLGKTIKNFDKKEWDKISFDILEESMRMAFEQNPKAVQLLLSTGNSKLTHKANISLGKWETLFPQILMKIREDYHNKIMNSPQAEYTGNSGGANGADIYWDEVGRKFGFFNFNHYYIGEKSSKNAPNGNIEIKENTEDYEEGRYEAAKAANVTYGYEYKTMKDPRLIRNWAQVKYSDAVFAIGTIAKVGERLFPDIPNDTRLAKVPAVTGGTGYAVQMAINAKKPVFVFDQKRGYWVKNINGVWSKTDTPILTKNFAAIGTRNINEIGKKAIHSVYEATIKSIEENKLSEEDKNNLNDTGFEPGKCK